MEKKKLLFVAISVGLFLALAIGAAYLIFTPRSVNSGAITSSPAGTGIAWTASPSHTGPGVTTFVTGGGPGTIQIAPVDAVDMVRGNGDVPGLRNLPEGASQQAGDFHVQGQTARTIETLVNVPKPTTAAVPETPPAGRAAPVSAQPAQPRPPTQAAPAPQVSSTAQTSSPAQVNPQTRTAPTAAVASQPRASSQTMAQSDYWVQTGAFSTVSNAEGVKEALASKGIASIIDNRIIDGRPLFRVRVGPYTSANEANYWLALIKSIDGFENSQIRQSQSLN